MPVTALARHQLFLWFEEQMGKERAATMMELMPPAGADEVATKADLVVLRAELKADMAEMKADVTRSLGTLIIASQAGVIAAVGLLLGLFTAIS
jgi:hypothetical protein